MIIDGSCSYLLWTRRPRSGDNSFDFADNDKVTGTNASSRLRVLKEGLQTRVLEKKRRTEHVTLRVREQING